jgi:hypothetical protein
MPRSIASADVCQRVGEWSLNEFVGSAGGVGRCERRIKRRQAGAHDARIALQPVFA